MVVNYLQTQRTDFKIEDCHFFSLLDLETVHMLKVFSPA